MYLLDLKALLHHCQTTQHALPAKINGMQKLDAPVLSEEIHSFRDGQNGPSLFRCNLCVSPKDNTNTDQLFRHIDKQHSCLSCLSCMQSFESFAAFEIHARETKHEGNPRPSHLWLIDAEPPARPIKHRPSTRTWTNSAQTLDHDASDRREFNGHSGRENARSFQGPFVHAQRQEYVSGHRPTTNSSSTDVGYHNRMSSSDRGGSTMTARPGRMMTSSNALALPRQR